MTIAVVTLAFVVAGLSGVNIWLLRGRVSDKDKAAADRIKLTVTEAESERTAFELDVTKKALAATERRAVALEELLAEEMNANPNADLAGHDVRSRLLRNAQAWRAADSLRAESADIVHSESGTPTGAGAAVVPIRPDVQP